jgi:hypothetical protein
MVGHGLQLRCSLYYVVQYGCAISKIKAYKTSGIHEIPVEFIRVGGKIICSDIHIVVNSTWNKEELYEKWKESIIINICMNDSNKLTNKMQQFYKSFRPRPTTLLPPCSKPEKRPEPANAVLSF